MLAENDGWKKFLPKECAALIFTENKWISGFSGDWSVFVPTTSLKEAEGGLTKAGLAKVKSLEENRIRAGSAWVPGEIHGEVLPLEIRIDDAVHENKGCYPGQEVIERIRAMGEPPRRLVRLEGKGKTPIIGAKVVVSIDGSESEAGLVTSSCESKSGGWVALALLKKMAVSQLPKALVKLANATDVRCEL